jgi:hypothetical protein
MEKERIRQNKTKYHGRCYTVPGHRFALGSAPPKSRNKLVRHLWLSKSRKF